MRGSALQYTMAERLYTAQDLQEDAQLLPCFPRQSPEERPHPCPHCPMRFRGQARADKHVLVVHRGCTTTTATHQCGACAMVFDTHTQKESHARIHDPGVHVLECLQCHETFTRKSSLVRHHAKRHA